MAEITHRGDGNMCRIMSSDGTRSYEGTLEECFDAILGELQSTERCAERWIQTLRDQFAMAALTGLLAGSRRMRGSMELAQHAYDLANCMLAARDARTVAAQDQGERT